MDIVVGTAGHIDHGKTALVKALTGVDADRFPEEKERGITIDIGFAELEIGGARIGFVDVPGHERFVKNMLAGASGLDVVVLVVAADEGVMPQTREHFEICRLLGIGTGVIALTKKDLVDEELLELVTLDVQELVEGSFLETAPVVAVSSRTGEGVGELRSVLGRLAAEVPERQGDLVTRLPIDRSFSVKGFGAVVTGTLASGEVREADEMEVLPSKRAVRVRGVQTYGRSVPAAHSGQRTAVNLGGIDHSEIERGMMLAEIGTLRPTQAADCEIEVLGGAARPLRSRQRVRVHVGTVESLARVTVLNETGEIGPGESGYVQFRFESPIVCVPDERLIVRFYSPQTTIAGGRVIDNFPPRHRRSAFPKLCDSLGRFAAGDATVRIRIIADACGERGADFADLQARTGLRRGVLEKAIDAGVERRSIVRADSRYLSRSVFERLSGSALAEIADFHRREPLARGIPRETLRERRFAGLSPEIFRAVIVSLESDRRIVADKDSIRDAEHSLELSADDAIVSDRLSAIFSTSGIAVPKLDEALGEALRGTKLDAAKARRIFQLMIDAGEVVKVTDEFYVSRAAIDELTARLRAFAATTADRLVDVAAFKELAGISRKYAIPLLEYFDREKITRRAGDKRLVLGA